VGSVAVTVRDPDTGAPLPDTQVSIREVRNYVHELTVADEQGMAVFDALPLWGYYVTAFHAPTGRSGRLDGIVLSQAGQHIERTLYVDRRGAVGGTLFDDPSKALPVAGGTVKLWGQTAGGPLTALDTTSGRPEELGRYDFFGIPEGSFQLTAAEEGSPRRANETVTLTATTPVAEVDLVLEPAGDVAFRILERLSTGLAEVDPATTAISARLQQGAVYDFTMLQPELPAPDHAYIYRDVLLERSGTIAVQELGGEHRSAQAAAPNFETGVPLDGGGSAADPYRIVLGPKGVVRVTVRDADSQPVAGANVTVVSSGGGRFPSVTGADGTVGFTAVPAGELSVSASAPSLGVGGRTAAVLQYDDDIIDVVVTLGAAVSAHGVVYQPVPGDLYTGDPTTLVPQADAIVVFSYGGSQLSMVTAADGAYRFDALPADVSYAVQAQTQDGLAVAGTGGTLVGPNGNDNEIPPLILDGGPPQILTIVPPPGMEEVSRTATVEIVFSEPLLAAVLPSGQPTSSYFELRGPGGLAAGVWNSAFDAEGHQVVRFVPSAPYDNRAVYSLKIEGGSNGIRDRAGRPLTASGDVGSNFTTSDSVGPAVIGTEPTLLRPVEGGAPVRYDFNEAVIATDEQLDGLGGDDAASLSWGQDDGAGGVVWQPLPITMFLTRSDYSLTVDPNVEGLVLTDDTLLRRIQIAGLEDSHGNMMAAYEEDYRVRDANPPVFDDLPPPPTAPDGQLMPGHAYTVTPVLSGIDHFPLDPPDGDLDRVEYFFTDPDADGLAQPGYVATASPYAFAFIAAYAGDGVEPRPFPIWARAFDTSENSSAVAELSMEVLPNEAPTIGALTATAVSPVAGTFYVGSAIQATVGGLGDVDNSQLSLVVGLWEEGGGLVAVAPSLSVTRPASGNWADLVPPVLDLEIPDEIAEGTVLYLHARATDASAVSATAESERFAVADDQAPPTIDGIVVRAASDGEPASLFYIGSGLYAEFTARDAETSVIAVELGFDRADIFPPPVSATRVSGDLFRSEVLTVPVDVFTEQTTVVLTVSADDRGGNTATATHAFEVAPEPDPTAPTVEWLTPWEGAEWPADYTSSLSPGQGTALLLRVYARDTSIDGGGDTVPGTIVGVSFRGPVADGAGGFELAASSEPGVLVAGTGAPGEAGYQLVWPVPDGIPDGTEIPFEVRVVDSGGLDVVRTVRMQATAFRRVYEGAQSSVQVDDPMQAAAGVEDGAVFLLDGTTLSIYPQDDGSVRALNGMLLYAGGSNDGAQVSVRSSVLTAPAITSAGSAKIFYPLELDISRVFAVGIACRVDQSQRGPWGSTSADQMVLPGETGAGRRAGGSHGGSGWFGAPDEGWSAGTLYEPASTFDSVRNPRLPGAGGGGSGSERGGTGGGVFRLDGADAVVRLIGDVRANGGGSVEGGGAGGTVRLLAGRLEGGGKVTANGGDGGRDDRTGGGGGGRIALLYRELGGGFDPEAQLEARGGGNGGAFLAGAGTIYLEALNAVTGESSGIGHLLGVNQAGLPAAPTLLPAIGNGAVTAVDPTAAVVTVDATVRGDVSGDRLVLEDSLGETVGDFPIVSQTRTVDGVELELVASEAEMIDLQSLIGGETIAAHGRSRFDQVRASGAVRLSFDDDLVVGPVDDPNPVINDPASLSLDSGSRAILRGDGPQLTASATPEPGSEVRVGSTIELSWTASDPVGLWEATESWPPTGLASTSRSTWQPLSSTVEPDPLPLAVPADAAAGEATYQIILTDSAGRSASQQLAWTVRPGGLLDHGAGPRRGCRRPGLGDPDGHRARRRADSDCGGWRHSGRSFLRCLRAA
jgi:hypothetical protein